MSDLSDYAEWELEGMPTQDAVRIRAIQKRGLEMMNAWAQCQAQVQALRTRLAAWVVWTKKTHEPFHSEAMFDMGPCDGCSEPIQQGDKIAFYSDGDKVHVRTHEGCWDEEGN